MAGGLYARLRKRASGRNGWGRRGVALERRAALPTVIPPIPDPGRKPKPSQEMAAEGEQEEPVQQDHTQPSEIATERDPQFARNGE